jgi:tRNA pseudouridine38-40 synthase
LYKSAIEQGGASAPHLNFWDGVPLDSIPEDDLIRKRQWRAPTETVRNLKAVAGQFDGSHKFHNFTVAQTFRDANSTRFMKKIEVCQ